jgi:hypothetical protein
MRQSSDMIMAAFCYVTAMMIWKIGDVLIYYGQADRWFVVLIVTLVVVSGVTFQFESLISKYEDRRK